MSGSIEIDVVKAPSGFLLPFLLLTFYLLLFKKKRDKSIIKFT